MACRGARIIESLLQSGRLKTENLPLTGKAPHLWEQHDTDLETTVCQNCPFFPDDCDFHSIKQLPGLEPCGGYILLRLLKQNLIITEADLDEISDE